MIGLNKDILVQYVEYITNIQGWYSYRDDFKNSDPNPTTYEYVGDKITGIALATRNISSWNGEYRYLTGQMVYLEVLRTDSSFQK